MENERTGSFFFVDTPMLVIWLKRNDWASCGVSLSDWLTLYPDPFV
jgi:hypothetical protein